MITDASAEPDVAGRPHGGTAAYGRPGRDVSEIPDGDVVFDDRSRVDDAMRSEACPGIDDGAGHDDGAGTQDGGGRNDGASVHDSSPTRVG
jgi:hypothetical protein